MNLLTQPRKPPLTSPTSKPVIYSQNLISPILYVSKLFYWISLAAEIKPFSSPGLHLTKHTAVNKCTSHDSLTLTSSPIDFPFHLSIAYSIPPLQSNTSLNALLSLPYVHEVRHNLKSSLSNDSTPIFNIFSYLSAANFLSRI